jgi:hypothetical protein
VLVVLPPSYATDATRRYPKNPPLYLNLPTRDGVAQPGVLARWHANVPLALIDQYMSELRRS